MVIQPNGEVNKPKQPAFSVKLGGNHTSLNKIIVWASEEFDVGNNYNTSNGRFTAPVAGKYFIGVNCYMGFNHGACRVIHCWFRKNGNDAYQFEMAGGTNQDGGNYWHPNGAGGTLIDLAANDYVQFHMGDPSLIGNNDYILYSPSYFYGYLVC